MRHIVTSVLIMLCMIFSTSLMAKDKAPAMDTTNMHKIFLGWVDMSPDDYSAQGYVSREEFEFVIYNANLEFQKAFQAALPGRTITAAKNNSDVNTEGNDLYIKFADAVFDHDYRLHVSVHFIDLKTNNEIGSIPNKKYTGRLCGLEGCMRKELNEVSRAIQKMLK